MQNEWLSTSQNSWKVCGVIHPILQEAGNVTRRIWYTFILFQHPLTTSWPVTFFWVASIRRMDNDGDDEFYCRLQPQNFGVSFTWILKNDLLFGPWWNNLHIDPSNDFLFQAIQTTNSNGCQRDIHFACLAEGENAWKGEMKVHSFFCEVFLCPPLLICMEHMIWYRAACQRILWYHAILCYWNEYVHMFVHENVQYVYTITQRCAFQSLRTHTHIYIYIHDINITNAHVASKDVGQISRPWIQWFSRTQYQFHHFRVAFFS